MNNISVDEIEKIFSLVVEKLKKDGVGNISFDLDEYWIILTNEWNDFKNVPSPSVGSFVDDVNCLKKVIGQNIIYSYSEFDRIAIVLRALSEKMAPSVTSNL
jgi:predicted HAD superfamily phosphohydrolase YqeG